MEDRTADAACGRIAVEAVRMALQGLLIFCNAARQVQTAADDGRVVGITERVVRRARRLDAEQLHGGREGLLSVATAGLRIEDHLRIVPLRDPVRLAVVQQDIVLQHRDVVKAPRQEDAGAADPVTEALERLGEGKTLLAQAGVAQSCELGDAAVELFIVFGAHQHLKFIGDLAGLEQAHCADLNDLPVDLHRQHLLRRIGAGPRLIPLHVQNDILHGYSSAF